MPDSPAESRGIQLSFLRDDLIRSAVLMPFVGLASLAIVVLVFDWDLGGTLLASAAGAILFGTLEFLFEDRERLPSGQVPPPPAGAFVETRPLADKVRGRLLLVPVYIALLVGLAWFVHRFDAGGLIFPGTFFGETLSSAVTAVVAARWETRHGKRLMFDRDEDREETLYAESPLALQALFAPAGMPPQGPIHPR